MSPDGVNTLVYTRSPIIRTIVFRVAPLLRRMSEFALLQTLGMLHVSMHSIISGLSAFPNPFSEHYHLIKSE